MDLGFWGFERKSLRTNQANALVKLASITALEGIQRFLQRELSAILGFIAWNQKLVGS